VITKCKAKSADGGRPPGTREQEKFEEEVTWSDCKWDYGHWLMVILKYPLTFLENPGEGALVFPSTALSSKAMRSGLGSKAQSLFVGVKVLSHTALLKDSEEHKPDSLLMS